MIDKEIPYPQEAKHSVTLIEGSHLTATDKRNILSAIEFLREKFSDFIDYSPATVPNYGAMKLKRKGWRKTYVLDPCPKTPNVYTVTIHSNETNAYGMPLYRAATVRVQVKGADPLYLPCYQEG